MSIILISIFFIRSKNFYSGLITRSGKASDCIGCGQCEKVCPQHLKITELMKEAAGILDKTGS